MDRVWLAALLFMLAGGVLGWYARRLWVWWGYRGVSGTYYAATSSGTTLTGGTTIHVTSDAYRMSQGEREHRIAEAARRGVARATKPSDDPE